MCKDRKVPARMLQRAKHGLTPFHRSVSLKVRHMQNAARSLLRDSFEPPVWKGPLLISQVNPLRSKVNWAVLRGPSKDEVPTPQASRKARTRGGLCRQTPRKPSQARRLSVDVCLKKRRAASKELLLGRCSFGLQLRHV